MTADNERNLGYDPEVALPVITPYTERRSERWKGVLKYAGIGFGLAIIAGVVTVEAIMGMVSVHHVFISGQLLEVQEILSDMVKSAQAGGIVGGAAAPWFTATLGYARYHSMVS